MKKTILSLGLLFFMIQAMGQDTTRPVLSKEDYLKKSRSQKTAGWILLGGGVGLLAVSAATHKIDIDLGGLFGSPSSGGSQVDNTGSNIAGAAGLAAIAGSAICFVSADKNKKRAATIAIGNQRILMPHGAGFVSMWQPALQFKIRL